MLYITSFSDIAIIFYAASLISLVYIVISYSRQIDRKNQKLIQFYLDMQFINRAIINSLNETASEKFCKKMIDDIKLYFDLVDIVIIDSMQMVKYEKNTLLRSDIIDYIEGNIEDITKKLDSSKLCRKKIKLYNEIYNLFICPITPDLTNDGLIVCIEKDPSMLNPAEQSSLENSLNLLKTRLMYD